MTKWQVQYWFYGSLLVLLLVCLLMMGVRRYRISRGTPDPLEYIRNVSVDQSSSAAWLIFGTALSSIEATVQPAPPGHSSDYLLAKTGMTRRSWGQWLEVELVESNPGFSRWRISSRPTWNFVLTNWGESRRVVEQLIAFISKVDPAIEVSDGSQQQTST